MPPGTNQYLQGTKTTCEVGTSIECLCCNASFTPKPVTNDQIEVEIISDLFSTFRRHIGWESTQEYGFDFREEQFPFCSPCSTQLVRVFKLDEQIQTVISDLTSKIMYSEQMLSNNKSYCGGKVKSQFYRGQTIRRFPQVLKVAVTPLLDYNNEVRPHEDQLGQGKEGQASNEIPTNIQPLQKNLRRFKCTLCPVSCAYKSNLKRHTLLLHSAESSKLFACGVCSRKFATNSLLRSHVTLTRSCSKGGKEFKRISENVLGRQEDYIASTRNEEHLTPPDQCQLAVGAHSGRDQTSSEGSAPVEHLMSEEGDKDHRIQTIGSRYECSVCHGVFNQKQHLLRHLGTVHAAESTKTFSCDTCSRKYTAEYLLKSHVQRMHIGIPCPTCGKTFSKNNIQRHRKTHEKITPSTTTSTTTSTTPGDAYKCNTCFQSFSSTSLLSVHSCGNCIPSIQNSSSGRSTLKSILGQRVDARTEVSAVSVAVAKEKRKKRTHGSRCEVCGKSFSWAANLKTHVLKFHTSEKDKAFRCQVCGRKFALMGLLKKHFRVHEKMECDLCNEIYSVGSLYSHNYLVHKAWECTVCNKTFPVDSIKEHVSWHKLQNPLERRPACSDPRRRSTKAARIDTLPAAKQSQLQAQAFLEH